MWRSIFVLWGALATLLLSPLASADQTDKRLGPLFEQLRVATDAADARAIEAQIWMLWMKSADAQSERLLEDGTIAMRNRDYGTALAFFDQLLEMDADFAEAWNKRATLHWLRGDNEASVRDIQQTLLLEPRHFGALSGLGMIFMQEGQNEHAIGAFRAGLAIHPFLQGARHHIGLLEERLEGEPL